MMRKVPPAADPDSYVTSLGGWQRALVEELRAAVCAASGMQEVVKWGHLAYFSNGPVLLIRAEEHRVLFGFWRGQRLRAIEERLKPGGKYEMATLELREGASISPTVTRRLTREAIALNKALGDPTQSARPNNTSKGRRAESAPRVSAVGYSATPLWKKLGIKEGQRILLVNAPAKYEDCLQPLPAGVQFAGRMGANVDLAQVFVTEREDLSERLSALRKRMKADAALWISWPRKSSKVASTVTENTVRELALPLGFVDIKVCAVSEVWSGLKLVVRKALR